MYRAKKLKVNPYMNEVFAGTKDYDKAMTRRATPRSWRNRKKPETDPCLGSGPQGPLLFRPPTRLGLLQ